MASPFAKADVRGAVPDYMETRLDADHPDAFADAARKARLWVASQYRQCGKEASDIDWSDDIVAEAALERSKYELYALQENEDVAADKKENASELLEAVLGECGDSGEDGAPGSAASSYEGPSFLGQHEGARDPRKDGRRRLP